MYVKLQQPSFREHLLYSHEQLYKHIWRCMHAESKRRHNKHERQSLLEKIYLSLYWKCFVWEGVGDCKDCNILTSPAPPDIAVCLSPSPGLPNRRPGGPALCWVLFSLQHLFSNSSDPHLIWSPTAQSGVPRATSAVCCFLYSIISPTLIELPVHWVI